MTMIDDSDIPTVTMLCEDCGEQFDIGGELRIADRDGGMMFVPWFAKDETVWCEHDPAIRTHATPTHDISMIGV